MLLQELIDEGLINCNLISQDKFAVIGELVELFVKKGIIMDKDKFLQVVKKREEVESTAIGDGVAIPHGRSDSVKELRVAFGRSPSGLNFRALDKKPAYLVFMIAAPEQARKEYLQAVAKVARFLKSKVLKEALLNAESPKEVMKLIIDFDGVLPESLKVETKEGRVIHK